MGHNISWWAWINGNSLDSFVCEWNDKRASYNAIYFDSFGIEHIPKETKKFIGSKYIITNIYRIQAYDNMRILLFYIYRFYGKR